MRALLIACLLSGVVVADAAACSCAYGDPRERLGSARAAFVGIVAKREILDEQRGKVRYTFDVERVVKGDVPSPFVSETHVYDASCGVDLKVGERVAFGLFGDGNEVGLCGRFTLEEIEQASAPYPTPAGSGRLALLVPGRFGDAGAVGYDSRGRLLGYVFGTRGDISVCPGSRYAIQAEDSLWTIRLHDLAVIARRSLPGDGVTALRCLDARARDVVAQAIRFGPSSRPGQTVRIRAGRLRTLARLRTDTTTFSRTAAIHTRESRIEIRPFAGGRRVLGAPEGASDLVLSPDDRWMAYATGPYGKAKLAVRLVTGGGLSLHALPDTGQPAWLDARRVVATGFKRSPIFRVPGLQPAGTMRGDFDSRPVGGLGRLFGMKYFGRTNYLAFARARATALSRLARALSGPVFLVPVPGRPRIDAPRRVADPGGQPSASQARTSSPCSSSAGGSRRT